MTEDDVRVIVREEIGEALAKLAARNGEAKEGWRLSGSEHLTEGQVKNVSRLAGSIVTYAFAARDAAEEARVSLAHARSVRKAMETVWGSTGMTLGGLDVEEPL